MAETRFVVLTHVDGRAVLLPVGPDFRCDELSGGHGNGVTGVPGATVFVRESPAEVLALLAGEGKADGIWDVVKKLRFVRDDAALRKAAAAATEITLVMRFDQLDRLVAYFDGRKTDA